MERRTFTKTLRFIALSLGVLFFASCSNDDYDEYKTLILGEWVTVAESWGGVASSEADLEYFSYDFGTNDSVVVNYWLIDTVWLTEVDSITFDTTMTIDSTYNTYYLTNDYGKYSINGNSLYIQSDTIMGNHTITELTADKMVLKSTGSFSNVNTEIKTTFARP